jgi:threonine 3-dehydrogenase
VTGCNGQVGKALVPSLYKNFGKENVVCSDLQEKPDFVEGSYAKLDVTNRKEFDNIVNSNGVNYILHMAGILSAVGEKNPQLAISVNIDGVNNALEVAKDNNTKIFIPSTIAVYGKGHDRQNAGIPCPLRPTTIYGITKVYMEQVGSYYHKRFGVDFRSLRYPGFVSPYEYESNGTTDYSSQIFFSALKKQEFKLYLAPERRLPMIYITDGIEGTIKFLLADEKRFTSRFYNLTGLSFSCSDIVKSLKELIPDLKHRYELDFRDEIALSWPEDLDLKDASKDWDWHPKYDTVDKLVRKTLRDIKSNKEYKHYFSSNLISIDSEDLVKKELDSTKLRI